MVNLLAWTLWGLKESTFCTQRPDGPTQKAALTTDVHICLTRKAVADDYIRILIQVYVVYVYECWQPNEIYGVVQK